MKRFWALILASKLSVVLRLACLCAGLSLVFMVALVVIKIPLFLVLGVGVAHAFGILGVLLFAIAVVKETLLLPQQARTSKAPAAPGKDA